MRKTQGSKSAALRHLHQRYIGDDPRRLASVEDERANLDVACADLRTPDQGGPKPT